MGNSEHRRNISGNLPAPRFAIEPVEPRVLLSVTDGTRALTLAPALRAHHATPMIAAPKIEYSVAAGVAGYSPKQIRDAYGFDEISFSRGRIAGDGAGQTIAIVDAYDHPTIESDLKVFSRTFGLPDAPSFTKVSQTGGSTDVIASDQGWAAEIALDVQWAHAIAPRANILLVEADSDSLQDLLMAVDYARNAAGVSVVSMSWGTSEFRGQASFDSHFTTPDGHDGVTFVAASGDTGSRSGPTWPSTSPNVLSVGGTSLTLDRNADAAVGQSDVYVSETGWKLSTGGTSRYESQPSFQRGALTSTYRTSPDVSYNADPRTGFAVYNSFESAGGWSVVGGTSAGAPQWAALIAIANQGRALNGDGSLDSHATLSAIYQQYGTADYADGFNDITTGRTSLRVTARSGYDTVTGVGTPHADYVAGDLIAFDPNASAFSITFVGTYPTGVDARKAPQRPRAPEPPAETPAQPATGETRGVVMPEQLDPHAQVAAAVNNVAPMKILSRTIESHASELVSAASAVRPGDGAAGEALHGATGGSSGSFIAAGTLAAGGAARGTWTGDGTSPFSRSPIAIDDAGSSAANTTPSTGAESMPGAVAMATQSPHAVLEAIGSTSLTTPPRKLFEFARFGPSFTLLADSVASFTEESALIPTSLAPNARSSSAWIVTAAVVGVDAMLFAHYIRKSRKQRAAAVPATARVIEGEEVP